MRDRLKRLLRRVVYRRPRSELLTRLRHGDRHLQGDTLTREDRFPALFAHCRAVLGGVEDARVLSFGCSTGEEVFSLARYLPRAEITGVDLNRWCLEQCVRANHDPRLRFVHRLAPEFAVLGEFDAIFCMAVLQRSEHRMTRPERLTGGFTFEVFERELEMLEAKLKVGGVLYLDHCDFLFTDTRIAERYRPLDFPRSRVERDRPVYGPDNRLVATRYVVQRAWLKVADRMMDLGD